MSCSREPINTFPQSTTIYPIVEEKSTEIYVHRGILQEHLRRREWNYDNLNEIVFGKILFKFLFDLPFVRAIEVDEKIYGFIMWIHEDTRIITNIESSHETSVFEIGFNSSTKDFISSDCETTKSGLQFTKACFTNPIPFKDGRRIIVEEIFKNHPTVSSIKEGNDDTRYIVRAGPTSETKYALDANFVFRPYIIKF